MMKRTAWARLLGPKTFDVGPAHPVEIRTDFGSLLGRHPTFESAIAALRLAVERPNWQGRPGWVLQTEGTRIYAHVVCGRFWLSSPQVIKRGRRRTAWARILDVDAE